IRGAARIQYLHVQHAIDADLHVVLGDADLLGNIERFFLQVVFVGDALDERDEDVKPRLDRAAVTPERLDDERTLLGNHDRRLHQHEEDQHHDGQYDVHSTHAASLLSGPTDMQ